MTGHREQVTREATWDRLLDRSLLGYTRLGPVLRRRRWPADPPPGALAGRPS